MHPRLIPLADLHEDPRNARRHPTRNRKAVRASLREFGQVETLVVQRGTGLVLGGNCRLVELRDLGATDAWCVEVDVQGDAAVRLALALNRSAELATWDDETLAALLAEAGDMNDLGWSQKEVEALLAADEPAESIPAMVGTYAILVTCESEQHQRNLLERMAEEGLEVRAWNL